MLNIYITTNLHCCACNINIVFLPSETAVMSLTTLLLLVSLNLLLQMTIHEKLSQPPFPSPAIIVSVYMSSAPDSTAETYHHEHQIILFSYPNNRLDSHLPRSHYLCHRKMSRVIQQQQKSQKHGIKSHPNNASLWRMFNLCDTVCWRKQPMPTKVIKFVKVSKPTVEIADIMSLEYQTTTLTYNISKVAMAKNSGGNNSSTWLHHFTVHILRRNNQHT